ncbi:MAG: phage major capsid protein, partial [Hyphomicrobiaceae bacterium]|nr:phage major capsid protein [Hyphomicrobiaceae bacterium]
MTDKTDYEKKSAGGDVAAAFDEFMHAFEDFKETNDRRLDEIERRGAADVLTAEKLARIDRALDQLNVKSQRLPIGGGGGVGMARSGVSLQHKSAFDSYVRGGESGGLKALEGKALSVSSDPDGGYLVPDETEATINRALRDISPIRAIAGVMQVSGSVYKRPFAISGLDTGWVGETAARTETATPTLSELSFPTMELYAMPAATASLLDDSAVNIDDWLAEEVRIAFAEQEGTAFVTGDGVNKPKGFLTYPTVASSAWTWGNIGTIATGTAGAFPASDAGDVLIDLAYAVKAGYRANAHFVMNRATQAQVRKLKDGDGTYLWQPSPEPGQAPTLMGFPVAEAEDMP